jgi:phage shock protein E
MNIDSKATIIDVRTPEEFAGQHVPGAINIPLDQLHDHIEELKGMSKPIVAYCRVGNRSGIAVAMLKQRGLSNAVNGGGIEDMLVSKK